MKTRRVIYPVLLLLVIIGLCVAGCAGSETPSTPGTAEPGSAEKTPATPESTTKDTLVVGTYADPVDMDPNNMDTQSSHIIKKQMYETLITLDNDGNMIPCLAESWEYTDDTTLIIKLRKDVPFHTGGTLKASDVIFSFNRMRESNYSSLAVKYIDLDKTEAIDDLTVKVVLTQPFAAQMNYFNWPLTAISSEEGYKKINGDYNSTSIGTGPYKLVSYVKDSEVQMAKFDDYWEEGKPNIENLRMRIIPESTTRSLELESGGIDIALQLSYLDVDRFSNNPDTQVLRQPGKQMYYLAANTVNPILADVRVRKAIYMAVDWENATKAAYGSNGEYATGFLAPGVEGYLEKDNIPYDPAGARKLLDETGFTPEQLTFTLYCANVEARVKLAEITQAALNEIGVTTEIKALEMASYVNAYLNGEHDLTFLGYSAMTCEASKTLAYFTSDSSYNKAYSWQVPEFDELVRQASATLDPVKRVEMYQEAQRMIYKDAPAYPILQVCLLVGARANVQGLVLDGTYECHQYKNVYFE